MEMISRSSLQTKKIAHILATEIRRSGKGRVVAMRGSLGSGKTTFVQGFADTLGVRGAVRSPTFVLMKVYKTKFSSRVKHLIHIDCYRLKKAAEITHLGLRNVLKDPDAIILIEWADRIKKLLPKRTVWISFRHGAAPGERIISFRAPGFSL